MIKTSKQAAKRLITVHGWSGILLGLALYIVIFSGAVVVLSHEIGAWSVSGHKEGPALSHPDLDKTLATLSEKVEPAYLEDVNIWRNSAGYIIAFFHTHTTDANGDIAEKGVRFVLDPQTLKIIETAEGFADDLPKVASSFLETFFIDLHVRLHAPGVIGLYLTGVLGLVLLVSAVSGFIMHRHLIKDIFLSPRLSSRLANTRDRHNLAGAWGIIFSILLAFTGAFFSFATTLGLPVIAITAFEGDQQKAMETVFGQAVEENKTPRPFIGIEKVVQKSHQADIAGSEPVFIIVNHLGRADALISTIHEPSDKNMFFRQYQFSGVTGEFLGEKTRIGTEPSLGDTLNGLMGVLHFGWFAGALSKIIWVALGLSMCYVILTGLQLWIAKREKQPVWRHFSSLTTIVGYGTPLAMSAAAIGFLIAYHYYPNDVVAWTINSFLFGVLISFIIGFVTSSRQRNIVFQQVLGLMLMALPLIRSTVSSQSIIDSFSYGHFDVLVIDLTLLLTGLVLVVLSTGIFATYQTGQQNQFAVGRS
jgi:uncharacterized iron-regulated membrane protein